MRELHATEEGPPRRGETKWFHRFRIPCAALGDPIRLIRAAHEDGARREVVEDTKTDEIVTRSILVRTLRETAAPKCDSPPFLPVVSKDTKALPS